MSTSELKPSRMSLLLTFSAKSVYFSEIGTTLTYLGESQKGHFPPHYSAKIAKIRSNEPKIAL